MAVLNAAKREIDIKIVYYGPALCGKTTNVQCIHQKLAPHQRGEITSLATKDDRTLFFDFLPVELGNVKGFKTRFHIYTVPGQVYYALTRRAVLTGVDGIVFVADSQRDKWDENIESLKDLDDNLKYYKKDVRAVPFVMQYNKRDLDDIVSIAELERGLNKMHVPSSEASAVQGSGVMETLTSCCKLVLKHMNKSSAGKPLDMTGLYADDTAANEPIIRITSEEPALAVRVSAFGTEACEAAAPDAEALGEPDIRIDLQAEQPAGLTLAGVPASAAGVRSEGLRIGTEPAQASGPGLKIIGCGQPQRVSDSTLRLPMKFRLAEIDRECSVILTLTFDNFKISEF